MTYRSMESLIRDIMEKKLTPAEKKKREDVAQAIERENPDMPMDQKMAIATATAKKVAEEVEEGWDDIAQILDESLEVLDESHFKVGDKVKCKDSGMTGKVVKLDEPEEGKYYTVERSDGKTVKYSPDELSLMSESTDDRFKNLPGKATHLTNKDIRHPEHGIISGSTTLRHIGGNNYEVRAGRAKGKTISLDKQHVQKMDEEVELDEAMTPDEVKTAKEVHRVLKAGESVGQGYGMRIKAQHSQLRRKHGADWRKKAGITEDVELEEEHDIEMVDGRARVYVKHKNIVTPKEVASVKSKLPAKAGKKWSFDTHGHDGKRRYMDFAHVKEEVEMNEEDMVESTGPLSSSDYMKGATRHDLAKGGSYKGKEIKSFHPNKEKEAHEYAKKHGYVVKKKELPKGSGSSISHTWDIHKEEVELEEAEVRHDRYMRSHGKKASGGHGQWMFTHKDRGNVDYKNEKEVHTASGRFTDAAKSAKAWAKKHGHTSVYVMEQSDITDNKDLEHMIESEQSHKVAVTVSDPNHTMVSRRKEQIAKRVIVKSHTKEGAIDKAKAYYKKRGYKVHDAFHHSIMPATSMKTESEVRTADVKMVKVREPDGKTVMRKQRAPINVQ